MDYSKRPKGMSRREYWSQATGRPKEEYSKRSSSNKSSSQSYSDYSSVLADAYKPPKQHNYKEFLDTSNIDKAYGQAKDTYLSELQALTPRYEALYKQLEDEKKLAMEQQGVLSSEEQAQQKRNIAKRGISVDESNQFYTTEENKLKKQQDLRSQSTILNYAGERSKLATAESADRRDFTTAITNLDLNKAGTIQSMIDNAKSMAKIVNQQDYQAKQSAIKNAMWEKAFEYNKSKEEADRALKLYESARKSSGSNNNKYNTVLSSIVATAYSTPNPAPYTRETIERQLEAGFPEKASRIKKDISKFFPNGWESMTPKQQSGGGNDTAVRELLDDIDKGASLSDLLKAYPDVPVDIIKKYYNG